MRLIAIGFFLIPCVFAEVEKKFLEPIVAGYYQGECDRIKALNENDCGLAGVWQNQITSIMRLTCKGGNIYGQYQQFYSANTPAEGYYNMTGKYLMVGPSYEDCVLGWVVAYNNQVFGSSNSTASWSGIHYAQEGIIRTHWILTHWYTSDEIWRTSLMNHDTFRKIC